MTEAFKSCGKCGQIWHKRADLVRDPELILIGYQPTFADAAEGLLLFTHVARDCGTTLAIKVAEFKDLVPPHAESIKSTGTLVCPSHCLRVRDLQVCSVPCQMGWVRQLIQVLRQREVPMAALLSHELPVRVQQTA